MGKGRKIGEKVDVIIADDSGIKTIEGKPIKKDSKKIKGFTLGEVPLEDLLKKDLS